MRLRKLHGFGDWMTDGMVIASTGIGLGRWHSIVVQVVSRSESDQDYE
jgi:hypothetical protein